MHRDACMQHKSLPPLMKISHDRKNKKLLLSQESYIEKVLERLNMSKAKAVCSPHADHLKLSFNQCSTSQKDMKEMSKVPHASAIGSLMNDMVCTRPNIAQAIGVVSWFLTNPGKENYEAIKWILRYLRGASMVCLCFDCGEPMLDEYTDSDMVGDFYFMKSILGFLMTFVGEVVP